MIGVVSNDESDAITVTLDDDKYPIAGGSDLLVGITTLPPRRLTLNVVDDEGDFVTVVCGDDEGDILLSVGAADDEITDIILFEH